jgi:hypothetical protein
MQSKSMEDKVKPEDRTGLVDMQELKTFNERFDNFLSETMLVIMAVIIVCALVIVASNSIGS